MPIRPKNYAEAVRLKRCLTLKQTVPDIDLDLMEHIYDFIGENPDNSVTVSQGILSLKNPRGVPVEQYTVTPPPQTSNAYDYILFSSAVLSISRPYSNSGSDGDGGSSGNNNNNNNNNG